MDTPDVGIPPQLARRMSMAEQYEYLRTKYSRRRALVTAGAVAGGLLTGCSGSGSGTDTASRTASPLSATSTPTGTGRVNGSVVTPSAATSPSARTRRPRCGSRGRYRSR